MCNFLLDKKSFFIVSFLFLFLFVLYSPLITFFPNIDSVHYFSERRLILVFLLPWLFCYFIFWLWVHGFSYLPKAIFVFVFILLLVVPAVLSSPVQAFSFVEPGMYVFFFSLVVVWGYSLNCSGQIYTMLKALVFLMMVAFLIYGVASIHIYLFAIIDKVNVDEMLPWGFYNKRFWSHIATWGIPLIPLAVTSLRLNKFWSWRFSISFVAAIWWWILILSMSRGSIVSILCVIVLVCCIFGRVALLWVRWMLFFIILGVILWLILSFLVPGLLGGDSHYHSIRLHSSGRLALWKEAWDMSLQYFPFGMGAFSWVVHTPLSPGYETIRLFGHPHNMYLFWAAEYGWWMVFGLLSVIIHFGRKWIKAKSIVCEGSEHAMPFIALSASVLSALVHSLVSSVFLMPASMLFGVVVLGLLWGWTHMLAGSKTSVLHAPKRGVSRAVFLIAFFTICLSALVWQFQVMSYYLAVRSDLSSKEVEITGRLAPRFWGVSHIPTAGGN